MAMEVMKHILLMRNKDLFPGRLTGLAWLEACKYNSVEVSGKAFWVGGETGWPSLPHDCSVYKYKQMLLPPMCSSIFEKLTLVKKKITKSSSFMILKKQPILLTELVPTAHSTFPSFEKGAFETPFRVQV